MSCAGQVKTRAGKVNQNGKTRQKTQVHENLMGAGWKISPGKALKRTRKSPRDPQNFIKIIKEPVQRPARRM